MAMLRIALVVFMALLTACSMLPQHKDDFTKINESFMARVRWGKYQSAAVDFSSEPRAAFVEQFSDADDLRVTAFNVERVEPGKSKGELTVHYRLEYHLLPSMTIKTKKFSLTWQEQFDNVLKGSHWQILDPFPDIL